MTHLPDLPTFERLAKNHSMVPVYRRLSSDLLTPVRAFEKIENEGSCCLFESVIGGEKVGRYSFLAFAPYQQFSAFRHEVTIQRDGQSTSFTSSNPLEPLRKLMTEEKVAHLDDLPPFVSGAIGYAAYDVIRYVEKLPQPPEDDRGLPDLAFDFYDRMIIFDNVNKTMVVVAMGRTSQRAADAYQAASDAVDELVERLLTPTTRLLPAEIDLSDRSDTTTLAYSNFEKKDFEQAVQKCVEYIRAGDIFQVVLSQRFEVALDAPAFEVYRTLRMVNPSPFMFHLRTHGVTLIGSSPEIMCRVTGDEVTVRPLAGTRPRGATPSEDEALATDLLHDPKERAEHVMLVDLGRNDVGRVAQFGSVRLSDIMTIERYSHVMHITSNVTGKLMPRCDAFDALQACLPAGTVSGAPKVRAMEIIDQLEPHRRGPYAGAVGYFDFSGNMDTCIALRTMIIHGGKAYVQAGAGIVADSNPTQEYEETKNKARGLLKAIEITSRRCHPDAP